MNNKVKLDNSNSRFAKKAQEKKETEQEFKENVVEYQAQQAEAVKKAAELSIQFMEVIKDTILNENKGPIKIDIEKSLPRQLADLSLVLNQDQTQPEGVGSAGVLLLLLKISLIQRDKINELAFKVNNLENNIKLLNNSSS